MSSELGLKKNKDKHKKKKISEQNQLSEKITNLLEEPQVQSWRAMMGCFQACYQHFETNISLKNFSYSKMQILLTIFLNPEISAAKMSDILYVSRANMSMFLKRLLEAGLIEEVYLNQSKRPVFQLTSSGLKEFESVIIPHLYEVIKTAPILDKKTISILKDKTQQLKRSHT